jgi:hypothetical protein
MNGRTSFGAAYGVPCRSLRTGAPAGLVGLLEGGLTEVVPFEEDAFFREGDEWFDDS